MEKDTKEHIKLAICIYACATIPKYKDQILKMNETWINDAKSKNIHVFYFLGEEQTDLQGPEYIYLSNILNDYQSASYKQNLGLKYICDNYDADFIFCCGTDTFVNIEKMVNLLQEYDPEDKLYIGGHGAEASFVKYYHSGGAGFILSKAALLSLYSHFENMVESWISICNNNNSVYLYPSCDVCIGYYAKLLELKIIVDDNSFFGCNYRGYFDSNKQKCCGENIKMQQLVSCHFMTLEDFDNFYKILNQNNYFLDYIPPKSPDILPDCTLVTGCFCLNKNNDNQTRNLTNIIDSIETVLKMPCYFIFFGDEMTIPLIKQKRKDFGLLSISRFFQIEKKDLWSFKYLDKVNKNREKFWPTRDERTTAESHLITCNKFDLVLQAIDINPFQTSNFGWIDCFLQKEIKICENYDHSKLLLALKYSNPEKFHIQILNVNDKKYKNHEYKQEYYQQYRYVVCGGFFTCGIEIGKRILNRLKDICIQATELGYGHGEEMFYLEVLDEFYDDIHRSYGDYGQIINNFVGPTRNVMYIYYNILKKYLQFGYNRECYDCAKALLNEIESFNIFVDYPIYLDILFTQYVSAYYCNREEAKTIAMHIKKVCNLNPYVMREYNNNKEFLDQQLAYVL
uniref:Fringe-like glycosyltransferase domain-containing protein n=1 Tax=viral metagenome TaxID=1070528 RepID=A0A6C0F4Y5_9ZZZZ